MVEQWIAGVELAPASRMKSLLVLSGIFSRARRVYKLPSNPVADVERPPQPSNGNIDVFTPEEAWALVRGARGAEDRCASCQARIDAPAHKFADSARVVY
jgi:integrase